MDWRNTKCGVVSKAGWRKYCRLPWCPDCRRYRARKLAGDIGIIAGNDDLRARISAISSDLGTWDLKYSKSWWECLRAGINRAAQVRDGWGESMTWATLGADGVVRGVIVHPGLHPVRVEEELARWARVRWHPDWTAGDHSEWIRDAVQASGKITNENQKDKIIQAGGWRSLIRRKGGIWV